MGTHRVTSTRVGALAMLVAAVLLGSCAVSAQAEQGPAYVVGDSTMAQVMKVSGRGTTQPGCGFTLSAPCLIPLRGSVPDDVDVIVAGISIWDVDATAEEIALGYAGYHEKLSTSAPVVWIEATPRFDEIPGDPTYVQTAALNAAVAEALGCELAPRSLRRAPSNDGIHYAGDGAMQVADRLAQLTPADAC